MVQKEIEKVKKAEKQGLNNIEEANRKKEWMIKKAEEKAVMERDALVSKARIEGEKLKKKTEEKAEEEAEKIGIESEKEGGRMMEKVKEKKIEAVDYVVKTIFGG